MRTAHNLDGGEYDDLTVVIDDDDPAAPVRLGVSWLGRPTVVELIGLLQRAISVQYPTCCVCPRGGEWHHPITGHCGGCGCLTCSPER